MFVYRANQLRDCRHRNRAARRCWPCTRPLLTRCVGTPPPRPPRQRARTTPPFNVADRPREPSVATLPLRGTCAACRMPPTLTQRTHTRSTPSFDVQTVGSRPASDRAAPSIDEEVDQAAACQVQEGAVVRSRECQYGLWNMATARVCHGEWCRWTMARVYRDHHGRGSATG